MIYEKQYNSAFHKTDLKEYLNSKNVDTIIYKEAVKSYSQ